MKRLLFITYFALFFLLSFSFYFLFAAGQWEELKSEHFIIYFTSQNDNFAREVLRKAEEYYSTVAEDLGYVRYSNFWKWENRVKIYLYAGHDSYLKATNKPRWSHGIADYSKKEIISYVWGQGFLNALLPHELAHLIFRDFVGFKSDIPLWLDEGVAQWEEKAMRNVRKNRVVELARKNKLFSLAEMMRLDVRTFAGESKDEINSVNFESDRQPQSVKGNDVVDIYYLEAFSLVGFLVEQYDPRDFVTFCRQLRDGKNIDDALRFAYPASIRSVDDLEKQWKNYIADRR
ncbi:MAG: hypothetical protein KKA52_03950 [Candidatus Omnitrophica bacterium]|nr:hypothetical protein [Candidatus Omnitrophota bacterium]